MESKESQSPNIEESFSKISELKEQYGNLDSIPEEELSDIGYSRVAEGHIAPNNLIEKREIEAEVEINGVESLNEKNKRAPFGRIEVIIPEGNVERRLKNLSSRESREEFWFEVRYKLKKEDIKDKFSKKNINLSEFHDLYTNFIEKSEKKIAGNGTTNIFSISFTRDSFEYDIEEIIQDEKDKLGDLLFQDGSSKGIYRQLERTKSVLSDTDRLEEMYKDDLNNKINIKGHLHKEYQKKNNFSTYLEGNIHFMTLLLKEKDFPIAALELNECKTYEKAKLLVNQELFGKKDNFDSKLINEEKELKSQIKSSSIENKKIINERLKDISNVKKDKKKIVEGIRGFFDIPKIYGEILKKEISNIQKSITTNNGRTKDELTELTFHLDAKIDPRYDEDPGKVSGDCTEGHPLPFLEPSIPTYNVKVFDETDEHVGNIYLLETTGGNIHNNWEKVWHLDAIQIPKKFVDWDKGIKNIIQSIGKEAEKKDIDAITINSKEEAESISNYDFIRDAAIKNIIGVVPISINIPDVDNDKYSNFQGSGAMADLVWMSEKNKHKE